MIDIYNNILKAKEDHTAYFHKNFFSDVPSWDDFLNCVFQEVQIPNPELEKNMLYGKDVNERLAGNVIITEDVYFSPQTQDINKYFKSIVPFVQEFKSVNKIGLGLSGPKISVGPRHVAAHSDKWDAFSLQCQGTTTWTIGYPESGYKEEFQMEPGDFLFFPKETTHELYCTGPRAGLIFNHPDIRTDV